MKLKRLIITVLMTTVVAFAAPIQAGAVPSLPHYFYGTLKINNADAPAGTTIEARVTGVLSGSFNPIVTTQAGKYGDANPAASAPRLLVQGNITDGATVEFFVNGVKANQTAVWQSGQTTVLNLTAGTPPAPIVVPPALTTDTAASITANSASLYGTLGSLGTATSVDVSFEWGTTAGGPYPNATTVQTKTGAVTFTASITGLLPGSTYYFRVKASSASGTTLGTEKSFTTSAAQPGGGGGGGGSGPSGGGGGGPGPSSVTVNVWGTLAQYSVSSEGKLLSAIKATTKDARLTLDLPINTVAKKKDKTALDKLEMNPALTVPAAPANSQIIATPHNMGPDGATFDPPITLSWMIDPTEIPPGAVEKDLIMAFFDTASQKWVPVPSVVNTDTHTITATISHFTLFAVVASLPAPTPTPPAPAPQPSPSPTPTPAVTPLPTPSPTVSPTPQPMPTVTPATSPAPVPSKAPAVPAAGINWTLVMAVLAATVFGAIMAVVVMKVTTRR